MNTYKASSVQWHKKNIAILLNKKGWFKPVNEPYIINQLHYYNDVILNAMASHNTSLTIIYSTVYLGTDERKHQSSASLAFAGEVTGDRWILHTKGQ